MNRRKFLGLSVAGSAIGLTGLSALAGSTKSVNLSNSLIYSQQNPGRWAKKAKGHVPTIQTKKVKDAVEISVTTPHEMAGVNHYIVKHTVYDEKFNVIGEKVFDPNKDKTASSTHTIKGVKGKIHVTSVCNKHDTWVASTTV